MYRVASYSFIGTRKETNQDSCCAEVAVTPYGDTALVSVCDGVGGLASGEIASCSVIHWLTEWFENTYPALLESHHDNVEQLFNLVQNQWDAGLDRLNNALRRYGRIAGTSLGTTCTAVLFLHNRHLIAHIGDCRVYKFPGDGSLEILTDDQTWVAREVARGNISPLQARNHPKKNVILQSVGTQDGLQTVFTRGDDAEGDVFMVCCDGFRNELFDDELIEAFDGVADRAEQELVASCEQLANLAMSRNEYDNITAAVLCRAPGQDYDHAFSVAPTDAAIDMKPIVIDGDEEDDEPSEPTTYLFDDDGETIVVLGSEDIEAGAQSGADAFSDMTVVFGSEGGDRA